MTRSFHTAPVLYEAGVAEFYDYSRFGSDPIRDLLERLDLKTIPMLGPAVIIDDKILNTDGDITRKMGKATLNAINAFHETVRSAAERRRLLRKLLARGQPPSLVSQDFCRGTRRYPDEAARRYIATAVHTDVAAAAAPYDGAQRRQERVDGQRQVPAPLRH
jgi:hypothetical protein